MQAKTNNITPPKNPSPPAKLPPATTVIFPEKVSQPAVSITLQPTHRAISSPRLVDDSVSAYWDYQFLFLSQRSETVDPITLRVVDGAVPPDFPLGTYYLTGPGLFSDDHGSTVHPLDGHGYLRAFTIDGSKGEVKFMAKYIQTEAQSEERDLVSGNWQFTHRGPFSVLKGGQKLGNTKVMKNVANTSVLKWNERLFCLWEGGTPYEIEPMSLNTIGKFDVIDTADSSANQEVKVRDVWDFAAEILKPILYGIFRMPPKRLLSHYKIDASTQRLLIMSCNAEDMLLPRSHFTFYELDSNFKMVQTREFKIPDHLMIHDWAFTDSHYILFANRIRLDIPGAVTAVSGLTPMITALSVNPSKSTSPIYLLPRFGDEEERDWKVAIEAPSQMWVLHVGNAFQNKGQNGISQIHIQASACSYKWFNFQTMFGYDWQTGKLDPKMMNADGGNKLLPHLVQVTIELDKKGNCEKCEVNNLNEWEKTTDFPIVNPNIAGSQNKHIYAATSLGSRKALPHFPFDTVVKLNVDESSTATWSVASRRYIGEPIFIPKGIQEDDGYLLVVEYAVSTQMCYLVILDAKNIGEDNALVARLQVPKNFNFPLGFHGFWAPV